MKQTTAIRGLVLALSLAAGAAVAQDAMTSVQVRAALTEGGYTDISDVEFKNGIWKADVRDANGSKIDVRLDPAPVRPASVRPTSAPSSPPPATPGSTT